MFGDPFSDFHPAGRADGGPGSPNFLWRIDMLRVLALEPYDGGSHAAMLDGWIRDSRHAWTRLSLPPHRWKWRMRHAALAFAASCRAALESTPAFDVIFATSMLNLAEFRGLAPPAVAHLPVALYFHENQLTYPVRHPDERDLHFAMTHAISIAAAQQVWFNSTFHLDAFAEALDRFVRSMPDHQPVDLVAQLRQRACVEPPGIDIPPRASSPRASGPLRLTWAARWEHDKQPEILFDAIRLVRDRGIAFRLDVLGESFRDVPSVFERAHVEFADHIGQFGFLSSREAYVTRLHEADVFISTAGHEFFGLSAVEAVAAGAFPLLPKRLAYPEVFGNLARTMNDQCFYGQTAADLAEAIFVIEQRRATTGSVWPDSSIDGTSAMSRYAWATRASAMDQRLEQLARDGT